MESGFFVNLFRFSAFIADTYIGIPTINMVTIHLHYSWDAVLTSSPRKGFLNSDERVPREKCAVVKLKKKGNTIL